MRARFAFFLAVLAVGCSSAKRPPALDGPGGGGSGGGSGGGGGETDAGAGVPPDGSAGCAVATFVTGFVPKRNVFVSPAGTDANDGLSADKPWRSLKNASGLLPGDLVTVADGTYPCQVQITVQGSATTPVVIRGEKKGATFDCSADTVGFAITSATYVALDGLNLRGATGDLVQVAAAPSGIAPDHIAVLNSRLENNAGVAIRATGATQIDVIGNDISRQPGAGSLVEAGALDILATNGVRIMKNQIHDYPNNVAVQVRAGSQAIVVDGNRVYAVREGLRLGGASRPQDFANRTVAFEAKAAAVVSNLVQGTVGVPFEAFGCDACLFANNTVYVTGAQTALRAAPGSAGADITAGSRTTALRVLQNIFMFTQTAPQKALDIPPDHLTAFEQARNVWFYEGGSIAGAPSTPPLDGEGTVTDQNPRFANPQQNLFTLLPGSPAAERGRTLPEVPRDATGACRTVLNIGAY